MADIFREIEDDVRRDKAADVWKKHGPLLVGLAVLIVLATAGWRAWVHYEDKRAEDAGARFEAAIEASRSGDIAKAEQDFAAIAKDAPAGYERLARFREAAENARIDPAKGIKAYEVLATDTAQPQILRDLARLREALLAVDSEPHDALKTRLDPLLVAGNPWGPNARELLGLAALKAGDYEAAGKLFDAIIVDRTAPPSLRQRADLLLGLVRSGPVKPAS
jgi:hypothetical protein